MDGVFEKHPDEKWKISFNFNGRLNTGENIASSVISAKDSSGNTVTSVYGTASATAGIVTVPILAGTNGETYTILCKVTTDDSPAAVHRAKVLMKVTNGDG